MGSNYHSQHHATHRKMLALVIEDMRPWTVTSEEYENALRHLNRADREDDLKWRRGTIRTYATCLACLGDGREENPAWIDGETPDEPEDIDCETCRGTGLVEIVDELPPVEAAPDDLPF